MEKKNMLKSKINMAIEWMDTKKIAAILSFVFIVSMLPNLYLAFFARPSGDDYGYSMYTHGAWINTHSLLEVFKAGIATTKHMCNVLNGDWFTVFLFTWMPEVFVPYSFWIVPIAIIVLIVLSTSYLMHEITVKRLGFKWYESLTITAVILIAFYQFIPSTAIGMYWYVGVVHYMVPHVVAMFLLGYLSKFERTGRIRYVVYSAFGTVIIGGGSYFSSLLIFIIYLAVFFLCFNKNKKIAWMGIPFITGLTALFFMITAPGNSVRGGDDFGFSIGKIIGTIGEALIQAFNSIGDYVRNKTFIFILLFILAALVWKFFLKADIKFKFRMPGIFIIFAFGIYASMFAPVIYSTVADVSAGPATMEYMTFILAVTASIIYMEGWLVNHFKKRYPDSFFLDDKKYQKRIMVSVICVCVITVLLFRGMLSDCVFKRSCEYITSGQADDFKRQIDSQMKILLDDSIKEAYLCPINDQQGPLMHMPVTEDPDAFTNWAVAGFYGKDKVVMKKQE